LLGRRRGRVWLGRRVQLQTGEITRVHFDGLWVLDREERRRDVIGFLHTHPEGLPRPSTRDVRTMRAWCSAFGKPLLCLIRGPRGLAGYLFQHDKSEGEPLAQVEIFPRGVIVAVE
jgi:hypothetical protein